ncbi:MAG: endolytic transglycosylase MltG [Spirochaeta sp.]|jgi:UPF0755 protein|nr:endolytic transglycosylase MltG [Spirochaeta sp.]
MKRTLSIVFGVLFLFSVVAGSGAWLVFDMLTTPHSDVDTEKLFEIRPGDGLRAVTRRLETANLIPWAPALEGYARWRGYAGVLQAGRYLLSPAMTPVEMIATIVSGDAVFDELTITIPEGWSANDIELYLEAQGLFTKEQFQEAVVMGARYRDFPFLADLADDTILDGYLFPDTYRIFADSTPEGIVLRMLGRFAERTDAALLAEIRSQERSLHEVLTLASIVQHESANDAEMPVVAGVFWNRLQIGMRLESDATVNYVLGTSKRQPTFADTEVQHPYNTYENEGLPPGPIGNPGLPAIRAAVYPAEHDYLFFLHKPTREIVLSRTFREHLDSKARYLD